jgi:hypothetical protein
VGAADASGTGLGGIWLPTTSAPTTDQPIAWRLFLPPFLQRDLLSAANPTGRLTNNDFELSALIIGAGLLASVTPLHHNTLYCASDNVSAVSWCSKGSTSSISANAHLLRWLAQLNRSYQFNLQVVSVPGATNTIADFCSRSFALSDEEFQDQLNLRFPTPQPWRIVHPPPYWITHLSSVLSPKTSLEAFQLPELPLRMQSGPFGKPFVPTPTLTNTFEASQTQSPPCSSSLIDIAMVKYLPAKLQSAVARWAMPFVPLARRWPEWASQIPV